MPSPVHSSSPSSCSAPPANIPYGGHCRTPVASCLSPAQPELGTHTLKGNLDSEFAFASRYAPPTNKGISSIGGGASRRHKRSTRSKRSKRHRRQTNTRSRTSSRRRARSLSRRRRIRQQKRRGGTGYYLDLSSCPPGGRPSPVKYDSRQPPVFSVNGYPNTAEQARTGCQSVRTPNLSC